MVALELEPPSRRQRPFELDGHRTVDGYPGRAGGVPVEEWHSQMTISHYSLALGRRES